VVKILILIMIYYKRNLPHIHPEYAKFFITFRLVNSLPERIYYLLYDELKRFEEKSEDDKKRYFRKFDDFLDKCIDSPKYLINPDVSKVITDKLHSDDKIKYDLIAYCIMPNHVHLLIDTKEYWGNYQNDKIKSHTKYKNYQLGEIMH